MILKRIRRFCARYYIAPLLGCYFMFFSCSKAKVKEDPVIPEIASALNSTNCLSYDKEDYFRAIFLLDGPLVQHIGAFEDLKLTSFTSNSTELSEARSAHDDVLEYINTEYPSFLNAFKNQVTSGNYDTVREAILDGTDIYLEALEELFIPSEDSTIHFGEEFLTEEGNISYSDVVDAESKVSSFVSSILNTRADSGSYIYKVRTVYVYLYFWLYIAAAAAILVILIIVLAAQQDFPLNPVLDESRSFLLDDYVSDITANFSCSN